MGIHPKQCTIILTVNDEKPMKKLALAFLLCLPLILNAQDNQQTIQQKAMVCSACHGKKGISSNPKWPNLAGQHKKYFIKQLKDLKQATSRKTATMTALLQSLDEKDMEELASYYAKMRKSHGKTPERFIHRGEQLYRGGDFNKHITACIACHGPKGNGNPEAGFPAISGQHAYYTLIQLMNFKNGKRSNDLNHIMHDICNRMDKEDMEAVAHYIEGLH